MAELKKIEGGKAVARRAVLTGAQIEDLWGLCRQATAGNNRAIEKRIDAAETKLAEILNVKIDLVSGTMSYTKPERAEYEFDELVLFGLKVALVQAIAGGPNRSPAPHGLKKYTLLPLARELGILKAVEKDTKAEEGGQELTVELDGQAEEETKSAGAPAQAPAQG